MKAEIFAAVKSMIAADPSVGGDQLELVLLALTADPRSSSERIATAYKVMSGKIQPRELRPLCKRREAAELLSVNVRTVDYYIRIHRLPCVKGGGLKKKRVIGIPRESVIEMMLGTGLDPQRAIK